MRSLCTTMKSSPCSLHPEKAQQWRPSATPPLLHPTLQKKTGLQCQGPQLTQSGRHAGTLGKLQYLGSGGASGKEPTSQCQRHKRSSWVGEIPWRRAWQSTPVFLPGESCGQRSPAGYSPYGYDWIDFWTHNTLAGGWYVWAHWKSCVTWGPVGTR